MAALGESLPLRDVQSLCLAVLDARLSERLRELSRRAGASRDEHRRQAQRTEARIVRHLKRKRARETELPRTSLAPTETGSVDTEVALASHGGTVDSVSEVDAGPARSRRRSGERWRADAPASTADGQESTAGLDGLSEEALRLDAVVMEFRDGERDGERSIEDALIRRAVEIRKRNFELARERLPKQPEAPRGKTHHDYFLEEMVWLATDFREESKWKTAARKRLLKALEKYHAENILRQEREAERLEQQRRRVARVLARSVRKFWEHIERLYARHREDVDARLQKLQMERQLQQLVQRTEQYTEVIAQRVAGAVDSAAGPMARDADEKREVAELQPPTVKPEDVDTADRSGTLSSSSSSPETLEMDAAGEDASRASSSESMSVEAPDAATADEADGVEAGAARAFEQLLQEYSLKSRIAVPVDNHQRDERDGSGLDTSSVMANGAVAVPPDAQHRLEASLDDSLLTRVLLIREPPLFRGNLRDYQLDGVNWMAALHEKRLNGILADEMGLGKTVQTIALFAWLASEMHEWGPHLCVVPTSVLLWLGEGAAGAASRLDQAGGIPRVHHLVQRGAARCTHLPAQALELSGVGRGTEHQEFREPALADAAHLSRQAAAAAHRHAAAELPDGAVVAAAFPDAEVCGGRRGTRRRAGVASPSGVAAFHSAAGETRCGARTAAQERRGGAVSTEQAAAGAVRRLYGARLHPREAGERQLPVGDERADAVAQGVQSSGLVRRAADRAAVQQRRGHHVAGAAAGTGGGYRWAQRSVARHRRERCRSGLAANGGVVGSGTAVGRIRTAETDGNAGWRWRPDRERAVQVVERMPGR
eukprot:ctg_145.g49